MHKYLIHKQKNIGENVVAGITFAVIDKSHLQETEETGRKRRKETSVNSRAVEGSWYSRKWLAIGQPYVNASVS